MMLRRRVACQRNSRFPKMPIKEGLAILGLLAGCVQNGPVKDIKNIPIVGLGSSGVDMKMIETVERPCNEPKEPKPGERIPDCALKREFVEGDDVEFTVERRRRLRQIKDLYAKCHVRIEPEVRGPNVKGYWVTLEIYGADEEVLDGDWISYVETGVNIHYVAPMDIKAPGMTGFLPYNTILQSRLYEFQRSNPELSLLLRFDNNRLSSMGIAPIYSLEPDPMLRAWIDYVRTGIRPAGNP